MESPRNLLPPTMISRNPHGRTADHKSDAMFPKRSRLFMFSQGWEATLLGETVDRFERPGSTRTSRPHNRKRNA